MKAYWPQLWQFWLDDRSLYHGGAQREQLHTGVWPFNCTCELFLVLCGEWFPLYWCCWFHCPNGCGHTQDVYFLKVWFNDTILSFSPMSTKHIRIAGKKSLLSKTKIRSNLFSGALKVLVALLVADSDTLHLKTSLFYFLKSRIRLQIKMRSFCQYLCLFKSAKNKPL